MAVVGERAQVQDARVSAADLYARHANHLFRFCLYQLRNRAEAEDAVQTTFLQAFRALQRGTIPHVERAWLIAIAQNVCRTMQRSAARRRDVESDADPELVAGAADADHPVREEISDLERALTRIPANQRRALVLHEWNGLRYREIAGVMGISQTAVEMLAFRARRSLSQALSASSSRARQALDIGGLLAALRGFLSVGSGAQAVAASGLAGVALATFGASPAPAHRVPSNAQSVAVHFRSRPVFVARSIRSSAPVRSQVAGAPSVSAADVAPTRATPRTSAPSQQISSTTSTHAGTPSVSLTSLPTSTSTLTSTSTTLPVKTPTLPVSTPTVTAPALTVTTPAVTVPPLPVSTPSVTVPSLTVSTPTVTLPTP